MLIGSVCSLFVLSESTFSQESERFELAKRVHEPGYHASQVEIESQYVPIGEQAPDLNSMLVAGDTNAALHPRGKLLLIEFWFAGCEWCSDMSRDLSTIADAYRDRGLSIIGADPYDWDSSRFLKFYSVNKPSYPLLMVTHRAQIDYGIVAYPMIYLLDEHRKVIYRSVGYSEAQTLKLQSVIESYLK